MSEIQIDETTVQSQQVEVQPPFAFQVFRL